MEKRRYIVPESVAVEVALEGVILTDSDISTFGVYDETTEEQI